MTKELEFFGTKQETAFVELANKIISNYNSLGGELPKIKKWSGFKATTPLTNLIDKVGVIIFHRGDPLSVPVFLQRVATGKVRGLGKPGYDATAKLEETFLGFGHFRNGEAYTLNEKELQALRMYLGYQSEKAEITEYDIQASEFLTNTATSIKIEFYEYGKHFGKDDDDRNIYSIKISNSRGSYTFKFGQSIDGTQKALLPTPYDILSCLTKYDPESFEDFCATFGYEQYNDYGRRNKTSYKLYLAVYKEWENIQKLFTDEQIELLQEIQ